MVRYDTNPVCVGICASVLITPVTELSRLSRKHPMNVNKLVELTGCQELPWTISTVTWNIKRKESHRPLNIKSQ